MIDREKEAAYNKPHIDEHWISFLKDAYDAGSQSRGKTAADYAADLAFGSLGSLKRAVFDSNDENISLLLYHMRCALLLEATEAYEQGMADGGDKYKRNLFFAKITKRQERAPDPDEQAILHERKRHLNNN